jgi:23S rRNA (uracil1939-C5)-methyltransferase
MSIIINEVYDIEIIDMTDSGEGIGKLFSIAVFVDGTVPGDKVKVNIYELKKNYAKGNIVDFIEKSSMRIEPICGHFDQCGGCSIQNMRYKDQLELKKKIVLDALKRIGKIEEPNLKEIVGMEDEFYYRNKSSFPYVNKIGYFKKKSHEIVEIKDCIIHDKIFNPILDSLRTLINRHGINSYDELTHKGYLRNVMLRVSRKTGGIMIVFVTNSESPERLEALINELLTENYNIESIIHNINMKKGNKILGDKNSVLFGEGTIIDSIGEFDFTISPNSFFQVNNIQTAKLYEKALEYASTNGNEIVFDLYSGIGTITLFLAKGAKKVYGIEVVKEAIADANFNMELNKINNVEFIEGEAHSAIGSLIEEGIKPDVVVVDPPRKGLEESLVLDICELNPSKVVYVSCKPSTLARDVKLFTENGYEMIEATAFDLFPHTMHVETIVKLQRKSM